MTSAGFNRRMRKTACPVVWKGHGVQLPVPPSDLKQLRLTWRVRATCKMKIDAPCRVHAFSLKAELQTGFVCSSCFSVRLFGCFPIPHSRKLRNS